MTHLTQIVHVVIQQRQYITEIFFSAGLQDDNDSVGLVWGKYANLQLCLQKRAELRLAAGNSKSCVSWIKHTWKKMSVSVFKGIKLKCLANRRLPDK